jgi:hypothetical protein
MAQKYFWLCMDAQCKQVNNFEKIIEEIKITGCDFYFCGMAESPVFELALDNSKMAPTPKRILL